MKTLFKTLLIFAVMATLLASCHDLKRKADLIIYNARIYTPDSTKADITCIAVRNGKIYKIGTDAEIRSHYWSKNIIDAKGLIVYPGFTDAHSHFVGYAMSLRTADLSNARSFDEVLEILKGFRAAHPDGWLIGEGWDQNKWPGQQFPDNTQLDKLFPGVPVVLGRVDGHAVLASTAAIEASGVKFPGKKGECIIKNGKFTGVFLEKTGGKMYAKVPEPEKDELIKLLLLAGKFCNEAGLTAVSDAGIGKKSVLLLDSLQKSNELHLRIDAWISPSEENLNYFLKDKIYETPFLRVGTIKMFADGALGSRGACMLKPYTDDPGNYGIAVTSPDDMYKICKKAYDHGFQMATHAIGDSGVRMVLHAYAKLLQPGNDRRWRIEHSQVVNENDFELYGKYNIIPSIQGTHATSDMPWAGKRVGAARIKGAYAYKRLLNQNGWLPNGTDFPIEKIQPLNTFFATTIRKDKLGNPKEGFQIENALSRMETLKSMTIWAAKSAFLEKERGSIAPCMWADFTILDTDLLKASETELLNAKVKYTVVNGKVVYKAK